MREWGRFSLPHSESQKRVTKNCHQKNPIGSGGGQEVGLVVCFVELFECLSHCMEVFLLGAGTLSVSSPFRDPLILSQESSSGRRPNGL